MKKFILLIRKENSEFANEKYISAIEKFGGEVVLIYDNYSEKECIEFMSGVSGILLPGGDAVGPLDFFLIKYAIDNNVKLLGICQGMQSMALFGSGDKLVEIGNLSHKQEEGYVHSVRLNLGKLRNIYASGEIMVNSHHRETVLDSHFFLVVGRAGDGLIEAVESRSDIFQIGVQWHPERMIDYDEGSCRLFSQFIK